MRVSFSYMPASISQAGLEVGFLSLAWIVFGVLLIAARSPDASTSGIAEPAMVRVVENEGRVLGAEMGELKNLKE
jgi:hypothetical protein